METYTPLYQQPKKTAGEIALDCMLRAMNSPDVRDGLCFIACCALSVPAGWYGVPYLASML